MEIIRVASIFGIGIVLIIIAILMTQENLFLTKKMKYTDESTKVYCRRNCIGQIIFAVGLVLEEIFSDNIFYYLGIGCLFVGAILMVIALKKLVKKHNM